MFLEYRDGRIIQQSNYDCFDPFDARTAAQRSSRQRPDADPGPGE
jgi:hypothetical protein